VFLKRMKKERSAGAVLFIGEKEPIYLLLHYEAGHWDLPKGNIESGESDLETVKREVLEETGIGRISFIKGFKEKIHYSYKLNGELISKDVVFYLASTRTKEVKLSPEHIGFEWLPYGKALEKLTYKTAKGVLEKADGFLRLQ
jgi:bis(5'-nucleosidyl)-tetraphosphatase